MAANSKIEWCHHTFNPWIGCTKVAAGCQHCYAERDMDKRLGKVQWGPSGTRVKTSEANWKKPLAWNRAAQCNCGASGAGPRECMFCEGGCVRPRVFCASLADVFEDWQGEILDHHGDVVFEPTGNITRIRPATMNDLRRELFALIDATPHLDWLLLTKRPENIARMWFDPDSLNGFPRRNNVWLGTSIANQADADRNIPELLKCRDLSPVLFLSAEPLLGPVDLRCVQHDNTVEIDALTGDHGVYRPLKGKSSNRIDWAICGSESGPSRRAMPTEAAESLQRQCDAAGVAFFMKQMEVDGKVTGDMEQFPRHLQIREFPSCGIH